MKLKTDEKGITLIEMLIALTIVAAISGALAMAVITMTQLSPKSRDWNIALRQVQNAGYWISRDVLMSRGNITVDTGDPFLSLTIPTGPDTNKIVEYRFQDMSGDLKRLWRVDTASGQQIMIAEYIYYNPSEPNRSTWVTKNQSPEFTIWIAAVHGNGEARVRRQYEATQRVPAASE